MIIVAGAWLCVNAVLSIVGGGLVGCILSALFVYPHVVFYLEMKKGIMTEENYPNEKHCCGCV
jgi:hypothetical protein